MHKVDRLMKIDYEFKQSVSRVSSYLEFEGLFFSHIHLLPKPFLLPAAHLKWMKFEGLSSPEGSHGLAGVLTYNVMSSCCGDGLASGAGRVLSHGWLSLSGFHVHSTPLVLQV